MKSKLDDILESFFEPALESIIREFTNQKSIEANIASALALPQVADFTLQLQDYRTRAAQMIDDHLTWLLINMFARRYNTTISHEWGVDAICYNASHNSPVTVGKLSISSDELAKFGTVEAFLEGYQAKPSDLTYSHHTEAFDNGRPLCPGGHATTFSITSKIHRVMQKGADPGKIQAEFVNAIAKAFFAKKHAQNPKRTEALVQADLESALGVGTNYDSIYAAIAQTRYFLVSIKDLLANQDMNDRQTAKQLSLLGPIIKNRREELTEHMRQLAASKIPPPLLAVRSRIKGQSFGDKYLIRKYVNYINAGIKDGSLKKFMESKGLEVPEPYKRPPNLDDVVGLVAIVHGNAIDYDDPNPDLPPPDGEEEARAKIFDIFYELTETPPEKRGFERGKGEENGIPKGEKAPRYAKGAPKTTTRGIYVDHRKTDDYFAKPKKTKYKALHFTGISLFPDPTYPIAFELQIKSNYNDTMDELANRQSHDLHRKCREALVEYLQAKGVVSAEEVCVTRTLLSPDFRYLTTNGRKR